MKLLSLAGTSLRVPRLGFGTSTLHRVLNTQTRESLLDCAWDLGIRYFDTAPLYGHGLAERELGKFLRKRNGAIIATKFGIQLWPWEGSSAVLYATKAINSFSKRMGAPGIPNRRDFSARSVRRSVEQSLKRLTVEHIDILYMHEPSLELLPDPGDLLIELARLKQDGKIGSFGLSGYAKDISAITNIYPGLSEILQVDVNESLENGNSAHVTFGHFRRATSSSPAREPSHVLRDAIQKHQNAVILFSTTRETHLRQMVSIATEIEPQ